MIKRIKEKQSEHDRIIEASANTWRRDAENVVHTNPDGEQNFSVNEDSFPDVVITDQNNYLLVVEEIETEDTVTEEEKKQWEEYAGFGAKFNLVVPEAKLSDAFELIQSIDNMNIQGYRIKNGHIEFIL